MNKVFVSVTEKHKKYFDELNKVFSVRVSKKYLVSQHILFVFAAVYGFREGRYRSLDKYYATEKLESFSRIEYIRKDPTLEALIVAMAYAHIRKNYPNDAEERIRNLTWDDIYTIAEGYAAGGVELLYGDIHDKDVFLEDIESKLLSLGGVSGD